MTSSSPASSACRATVPPEIAMSRSPATSRAWATAASTSETK